MLEMRIPAWRLALTGGAIVLLLAVGVGFVAASSASAPTANTALSAAGSTGAPSAPDAAGRAGLRQRIAALLGGRVGLARHFVDGTLTFTKQDGTLVTIQLDHGTVVALGSDSITISEAGGKQVTLATDASTVVRLGGGLGVGKLSDLKVGDQLFVQSRVDGGTVLAKHILRVPVTSAPAPGATQAPSTNG